MVQTNTGRCLILNLFCFSWWCMLLSLRSCASTLHRHLKKKCNKDVKAVLFPLPNASIKHIQTAQKTNTIFFVMKKNKNKNAMKFRGGKEQIGRSWTADGRSRTPLTQKHFCCEKPNSDAEVEIMQSTQGLEESKSKSKSNSVDKFLGYKWPRFPKSNPIGG